MKLSDDLEVLKLKVKVKFSITLWEAIKLRIAGKAYNVIADEVIKRLQAATENK
jgi:hypothetical protein